MKRRSIEKREPRTEKRTWGNEIFLVETPWYIGKRLEMNAGTAGGLQVHVEKEESFYLLSGEADVDYDNGAGELIRYRMTAGELFHIPTNATHRVTAVTDCVFFEWSRPILDDRIRVEPEYGLEIPAGELQLETTWTFDPVTGAYTRKG
jgi:mannose-6-phosphate isomerase-like protein (cupin superfamily)